MVEQLFSFPLFNRVNVFHLLTRTRAFFLDQLQAYQAFFGPNSPTHLYAGGGAISVTFAVPEDDEHSSSLFHMQVSGSSFNNCWGVADHLEKPINVPDLLNSGGAINLFIAPHYASEASISVYDTSFKNCG